MKQARLFDDDVPEEKKEPEEETDNILLRNVPVDCVKMLLKKFPKSTKVVDDDLNNGSMMFIK